MAYAKRYPGGFVDLPTQTSAVDSTFLNAVEAALLKLFDADPTVDGQVPSWIAASSKYGPALLLNKNIDAAAAIVKSKIDLTGANGIVNADVAGAAAIARSKLNFGSGLVDADVAAAAAVSRTKLLRSITKVYNSAPLSVVSGANTLVLFDSESADDENLHDNVTNNSRITFPAGGGLWLVGSFATFADPGGVVPCAFRILLNGVTEIAGVGVARDNIFGLTKAVLTVPRVFIAGDYIELFVQHTKGSNNNLNSGADTTNLWAVRL